MQTNIPNVTVTIHGPTTEQWRVIQNLLSVGDNTHCTEGTVATATHTEKNPKPTRSRPAKTVSPDEDEDFGTDEITAKHLRDEAEAEVEEESDEEDDSEDEDADEEESDNEDEETVDWTDLKVAVNKYGNKNPEAMKAILSGFNLKSTKELKLAKNKWEPVYRKVMAKLKKK